MKVHFIQGVGLAGNMFLIDAEKCVLIDAGWDSDITYATKKIDGVLNGRKVDKIILTHRHIDHIGGASAFKEHYGAAIFAHELDADCLLAGDNESTGATTFGSSIEPIELDILKTNDTIKLGGGQTLKVIYTPGHTIGSICLLSNDGCLFSGDTVFTSGGVGRWDFPTGSLVQLRESLEELVEMQITHLYPGHGPYAENNGLQHIRLGLDYLREIGDHV